MAIQDQKPTCDSEGFADVSLSSNRDSDLAKPASVGVPTPARSAYPLLFSHDLDFSDRFEPSITTPRFGCPTSRRHCSSGVHSVDIPAKKLALD